MVSSITAVTTKRAWQCQMVWARCCHCVIVTSVTRVLQQGLSPAALQAPCAMLDVCSSHRSSIRVLRGLYTYRLALHVGSSMSQPTPG
jgi:hypothetical protein